MFDVATQSVDGSVAKDITLKAMWGQFKWTIDTDSGHIEDGGNKKSVIRFLFDIAATEEIASTITETGIKYINAADLVANIENIEFAGASETGKATTFYGDITDITEDKAGTNYYAIAYVKFGEKYYWSEPVFRQPEFNDLIEY